MIFTGLPEALFGSPAKVAVLRELFRSPELERAGREIARAAGVSAPWTLRVLSELEALGLVQRRRVPPADLWSVNLAHALADEIRHVLQLDRRARERLVRSLRPLIRSEGVRLAVLFGSWTRREETAMSDVDLLIVVGDAPTKRRLADQSLDLSLESLFRFGNRLHAIVYTEREFRQKRILPFVRAAEAEGLVLKGAWL